MTEKFYSKLHMLVHKHSAPFIRVPNETPKQMSWRDRINTMPGCSRTMDCYSGIKRNEVLTHDT